MSDSDTPATSESDTPALIDDPAPAPAAAYRVLARKYRPQSFAQLLGQEALVRTLTNAIAAGRVHHGYILTGVRGVGKTTTARVIARALNCIGPDGSGGPTPEPCGVCPHCVAIAEDRHVDVREMDAASHTGIDNMREVLDGVRYRPVTARTKVYIVDEVHMLSKQAFNALLKTLEEPPDHVVFIFATTEIRRVPITVVSRCMRFDLRRIDEAVIAAHLAAVCTAEGRDAGDEALALLARAGDGSMRDALSLLDQALATSAGATLQAEGVRAMLGLADRAQVVDLFAHLMDGDAAAALDLYAAMHRDGADPLAVNQDLLEVAHWLTRLVVAPADADAGAATAEMLERGRALAARLSVPALTRAWQILMKGIAEVQAAPNARMALDMILIRLAYVRDLPDPGALAALLAGEPGAGPGTTAAGAAPAAPDRRPTATAQPEALPMGGRPMDARPIDGRPRGLPTPSLPTPGRHSGAPAPADERRPPPALSDDSTAAAPTAPKPAPNPTSFEDLVALVLERREGLLHAQLRTNAHLVRFQPGRVELRLEPETPPDLATRLSQLLTQWTGNRWLVGLSQEPGAPTIREREEALADGRIRRAAEHPLVRAALDTFPGAVIEAVHDRAGDIDAGDEGALPDPDHAINDEG